MTRLQGGKYIFKDNLGGICSTCNELGYEVFEEIEQLLKLHISNVNLQFPLWVKVYLIKPMDQGPPEGSILATIPATQLEDCLFKPSDPICIT
ncbi:hypothetical protein C2G38_2209182 [Gigaspora rosea]|uniref:Uncharacterized protein n=1 Tax=Gigaspora rosea TaxID=44941 RepID=A0A397UIM5_9GLOM|nr:hypothetical protein C2G38_2209182 [Gigaspora rosea]